MLRLTSSQWKGNIRELQNTVERAMILGAEPLLQETDLVPSGNAPQSFSSNTTELKEAVRQFELAHFKTILNRCNNDKRKAAKELGISLSSLYRYLGDAAPAAE